MAPPLQKYDVCIIHLADARFYPFFMRQAFALRDHGLKVALVSWENKKGQGNPNWEGVDCYPIYLPIHGNRGKLFFLKYLFLLSFRLLKIKARLYQAVDPYTLWPAKIASLYHSSRYNYFSLEYFQGMASVAHRFFVKRFWLFVEKIAIKKAVNVATVGQTTSKLLNRDFHIPLPWVILNVPDSSEYEVERELRLRKQIGVSRSTPVIVYKGEMERHRGLMGLLTALEGTQFIHLALIGSGTFEPDLKKRAAALSLSSRVHFLGRIPPEQFAFYLKDANLGYVVHESSDYNLSITLPSRIFDYIHSGLPVIASKGPEIGRITNDYQIGWVVDPLDPNSLKEAIQNFQRAFPNLDKWKKNCSRAAADFCWENEKKKYVRFVETALTGENK